MEKVSWKGGALLAPLPAVMVSSGTLEKPNVMTVAWTGIINTQPSKTYISVRKSRYSYDLIKNSGSFVINLVPSTLVKACDFCGVRSGRDIDKFKFCNLTAEASFSVDAPSIAECPLSLECRVSEIIELGSHDMFLADIVSVAVKKDLIDQNGRLALEKAGLLAYVHGEYFTLGKKIGSFGYSVKKKRKPNKVKIDKSKKS
ncbi:MAG: flavin reductase family protein [Clostridia bacterium]|nr:flavin reductase family protein [Clostridia bacterium]